MFSEISKAVFLLDIAETEVRTAIDLADLEHSGAGSAAAYVLLRDALARLRECRALPNVQELPDQAPYDKQYPPPNLTPCEVFTAGDGAEITRYTYPATQEGTGSAESKAEPPPVKMVIQGPSRRFEKALESGDIP